MDGEQDIRAKVEELKELLAIMKEHTSAEQIIENRLRVYEEMLRSKSGKEIVLDGSKAKPNFAGRVNWLIRELDKLKKNGLVDYEIEKVDDLHYNLYIKRGYNDELRRKIEWVNR